MRDVDLYKVPGVAETLDWTRALVALGEDRLDEGVVQETLGVILKNEEDVARVREGVAREVLSSES